MIQTLYPAIIAYVDAKSVDGDLYTDVKFARMKSDDETDKFLIKLCLNTDTLILFSFGATANEAMASLYRQHPTSKNDDADAKMKALQTFTPLPQQRPQKGYIAHVTTNEEKHVQLRVISYSSFRNLYRCP